MAKKIKSVKGWAVVTKQNPRIDVNDVFRTKKSAKYYSDYTSYKCLKVIPVIITPV